MNTSEQMSLFDVTTSKLKNILMKKGSDYGAEDDILKNFHEVSAIAKILKINVHTARGYSLLMIVMKIHRICNLLSQEKSAENESVVDSMDDLLGYSFLLKCISIEIEKISADANSYIEQETGAG